MHSQTISSVDFVKEHALTRRVSPYSSLNNQASLQGALALSGFQSNRRQWRL